MYSLSLLCMYMLYLIYNYEKSIYYSVCFELNIVSKPNLIIHCHIKTHMTFYKALFKIFTNNWTSTNMYSNFNRKRGFTNETRTVI